MKHPWIQLCLAGVAFCLAAHALIAAQLPKPVESALARAGKNRDQIQRALDRAPASQQEGMQFLVTYMPEPDLKSLSAEFLLANVHLAYRAWNRSPWKEDLPKEIFLNNVLPYASVNEPRDDWRGDFYERFKPLVKDANSPADAAAILNRKLFPLLEVRYSKKRQRADQSPYESMTLKTASCTGLSILLIDACRAVGVPARFVGTPLWTDKSGNHSWVEIWDHGWHFTGAAEPTGDQLDQAWFVGRASSAQRDHPLHAIYAVSYRRTPQTFPLVWDRSIDYVFAVNVTDRYVRRADKLPDGVVAVAFRVLERPGGDRLAATLTISDAAGKVVFRGNTKDERFDANDHVVAALPLGQEYRIEIRYRDRVTDAKIRIDKRDAPFTFVLETSSEKTRTRADENASQAAVESLEKYLASEPRKRRLLSEEAFAAIPLTREDSARAETLLWQDHVRRIRDARAEEMKARELRDGDLKMPYESSPLGLRNIAFTIHVGGRDAAYSRNKVARDWERKLAELHKADPDGYVHWVKIYSDKGHWLGGEDSSAIPWMANYRRNPLPSRIVWKQGDVANARFYWLAVEPSSTEARAEVTANRIGQRIDIQAKGASRLTVRLNDQLVNLDEPIVVASDGKPVFNGHVTRTIAVLAKTLGEHGDPKAVFSGELAVDLPRQVEANR